MTTKKHTSASWSQSDKSLRAVQVIFELGVEPSRVLRISAIEQDLSPSDYIREVIGLPRKKPIRPRLSISLSSEDYQILAERYDLPADEKEHIREKIKEELLKISNI